MEARGKRSLDVAWLSKILMSRGKRERSVDEDRNAAKEWVLGS